MINFSDFRKPQRYIGNEWNVVKKSHQDKIPICFCYPDDYTIGMSNVGIRIAYGLLNNHKDIVCERVFMPDQDLSVFLKKENRRLFSLETKTTLDKFQVLGFHLGCELNFTNFLHILTLGGVALKSKDRGETMVIGGGIANPEPLAEFVDVFYIGEFEEAAESFLNILRKYKNKKERLKALSEVDGFYVPQFYHWQIKNNSYCFEKNYPQAQLPVKKAYVKDLDNSFYPVKWLTPYTQIVHDRAQIEIARGCPNRCTFCQARATYFPYRQRSVEKVKELIKDIYRFSGYENFSFLSLSTSDYTKIEELIDETYDFFKNNQVGLSFPSLRIDDVLGPLYKKLLPLKKTSLTVAVESASERLRKDMHKKIDINKLFEAADILRSLKIKRLKAYFMFGLPQENEDDLSALGQFINCLRKSTNLEISASINIFIPKPFSIWEDVRMAGQAQLEAKREVILKNMPKTKRIKISLPSTRKSLLEAVISRADRSFSKVIYRAYLKGARYDNYREHFSWQVWEEAMKEEGVDYRDILSNRYNNFPWFFIENCKI